MKGAILVNTIVASLLVACSQAGDTGVSGSACGRDRDCDDSIACTADRCVLTVDGIKRCDNVPDDSSCPPGQACLVESVMGAGCQDPDRLICSGRSDGSACTSTNACATDSGECSGGVCVYPTRECPSRPCMEGTGCDRDTGTCGYSVMPDDTLCDADGDRCTSDRCRGGICVEGPDECECSDDRPCMQPANLCLGVATCEDGRCVSTPVDCPSRNSDCMQYFCVPATGLCASVVVNEGGSCSDGLACTGTGTCDSGACVAPPLVCPPRSCNEAACVEPEGCVYSPIPGPCDDSDMCNGPDACDAGVCRPTGTPVVCSDHNECTTDSCIPSTGRCLFVSIPKCCGNGVLEDGEQCDGPGLPGSGCTACMFDVASLDFTGTSPSWAWSDTTGSGLVAWEMIDNEGGRGIAVRPMSGLGVLGETIPVPAGTLKGRSMSPVVVAAADGFILGALAPDGPSFWLLGADGRPRIKAVVRNPWNQGIPSSRLVAAISPLRGIAAWSVQAPDGRQQLLYADIASGSGQILASGSQTLFTSDPGGIVVPGDACPISGGVMVLFTVRAEPGGSSVIRQMAAILQAGSPTPVVFELATSVWDQSLVARCSATPDGKAMAVFPAIVTKPEQELAIESVVIDPLAGPNPVVRVLGASDMQEGTIFPFQSDLVAMTSGGYSYITTLVTPNLQSPTGIVPVIIPIEPDGTSGAEPFRLPGPDQAFVGAITAGLAGSSVLSVFWVQTGELMSVNEKGEVAGRLYQDLTGGTGN
ncbi:MAG TPA: hypothetical protein PLB35_06085 [Myxococcota bacterium]|nr:hypothetical protein [Myxococcota bacterium]HOH76805.1 hypothetical protein [Myxococcota bacterium]